MNYNPNDIINILSIVVLFGFIIALGFLIALLYRANRTMAKLDNLSGTFSGFVKDIVPAIINIGTISSAMHSVMRSWTEHVKSKDKSKE